MAEIYKPVEIAVAGQGIGKWRMVRFSDETKHWTDELYPLCPHEHDTIEEARSCPEALAALPPELRRPRELDVLRELPPRWKRYLSAAAEAGAAWDRYENGSESGDYADGGKLEAEMIATQSKLEDAERAMSEIAERCLALLGEGARTSR